MYKHINDTGISDNRQVHFIFASFWLNHYKLLNYNWSESQLYVHEHYIKPPKSKGAFCVCVWFPTEIIGGWQLSDIKRIRNAHGLLFYFLFLSYMFIFISGTSLLLSVINLVVLVQLITSLVLQCSIHAMAHVCCLISFLAGGVSLPLWWSHDGDQSYITVY